MNTQSALEQVLELYEEAKREFYAIMDKTNISVAERARKGESFRVWAHALSILQDMGDDHENQ